MGGVISKTTNGGTSWINTGTGIPWNLNGIDFINENTGFVCGYTGTIYKTTNAGANWVIKATPTTSHLWTIFFANSQTGYAAGNNGAIIKSVNEGETWTLFPEFAVNSYYSSYFINEYTGYLAGTNGLIIKTVTGGITSVTKTGANTPKFFLLEQNYPNPFNPSTKIKFSIPYSPFEGQRSSLLEGKGDVKLVVFNILGQQIAELVNQQLLPGTYEVEWPAPSGDASGFASGVYFYSLITESFRETKKMVLIK
jgi:hypothetical protein